jgi:hypothetical protein
MTETLPAAAQEGDAVSDVDALKQSQLPFNPPEKEIFPPGRRDAGLALTDPYGRERMRSRTITDLLDSSVIELQWIQLRWLSIESTHLM